MHMHENTAWDTLKDWRCTFSHSCREVTKSVFRLQISKQRSIFLMFLSVHILDVLLIQSRDVGGGGGGGIMFSTLGDFSSFSTLVCNSWMLMSTFTTRKAQWWRNIVAREN